jgi:ATP-dependent Clp protease ATP-binding subunit ClpC
MHRLLQKNIKIEWDDKVITNIALSGYSPEYGARPIRRKIRSTIEDQISKLIINNEVKEGGNLVMIVEDNNIKVTLKK